MPENVVKIEFQADDTQTTAAFSKLNADMGRAQASMAAWRAETGLAAQATVTHGRAMADLSGHVGKTAADFKAATPEMRKASLALDEVEKSSGRAGRSMISQMREARFDVALAAAAVYGLAEAWGAAAKAEASSRHLAEQAGPGVAAATEKTAAELAVDPDALKDITRQLSVAGLAGDNLTDTMKRVAEASKLSGVPMQALEQIIERVQTGAHATWADMKLLTEATGGLTEAQKNAAQSDADQFRARAAAQVVYERDSKAIIEANRNVFQRSQEKISGQDTYAAKTGLGDKSFAEFIKKGGFANEGEKIAEEQRPRTFGELWGQKKGESELMKAEQARYKEGVDQLAKEGGSSHGAVMDYIKSGAFNRSDVMSASGRSRAEAEQTRVATERTAQEREGVDFIKGQDRLRSNAVDIIRAKTPEKAAQLEQQKNTPEGQAQQGSATIHAALVEVGTALSGGALDMVSAWGNRLTGYDPAAHPLKGSEMPAYTPRVKKPGEPGYDWSGYKPPAGNDAKGEKNNEDVVKAITGVIETLNRIFVSGSI